MASALFCGSHAVTSASAAEYDQGFSNESALGLLAATGNSRFSTLDLKQTNYYRWPGNSLKFQASYIRSTARDTLGAKNWITSLRIEPMLGEAIALYFTQAFHGNTFNGYDQQSDSETGIRWVLHRSEWMTWAAESGYRYTIQNRTWNGQHKMHYFRAFTEALFPWSWRANAGVFAEYLPNLTESDYWQANAGTAVNAVLTEILSLRFGYALRFSNLVLPGATTQLDTTLMTSLVLKW